MDPVSKPTFVLEPGSGSGDQMRKQCCHLGVAVAGAAITDSVASAQQSQSANCLSDICFTLYKLQMALAASGTVIKLHITTMAGLCLRVFAVKPVLCTSWINDDPWYYDFGLTCCVHSQYEYDYTIVVF